MVKKEYWDYYTFNDNLHADVIDVLFEAAKLYGDAKYRKAAEKAGDFILLAQMPEPQPGWAQQYDVDMHPAWARKFEPPSITGGESQGVMQTLLRLYRETGDKKYLEPMPARPRLLQEIAAARRPARPLLRTENQQAAVLHEGLRADIQGRRRADALRLQGRQQAGCHRARIRALEEAFAGRTQEGARTQSQTGQTGGRLDRADQISHRRARQGRPLGRRRQAALPRPERPHDADYHLRDLHQECDYLEQLPGSDPLELGRVDNELGKFAKSAGSVA